MLESLHISNYALISSIDIDFHPKLNIITGETGAGKSIILGALSLILGGRADLGTVRDKTKKTVVEAIFNIEACAEASNLIRNNDIDEMDGRCILRREITAKGGSRAFVNDTPVTLPILRSIAILLVDIHSQHQNLLLADPEYQLSIIDNLAGNQELLAEYVKAYTVYKRSLEEYKNTRDIVARSRSDEEFITFQLQQLEELDVHPGETRQLERDREILSDSAHIRESIATVQDVLTGGKSVTAELSRAIDALISVADVVEDASDLADRLNSAKIEIQDVSESVSEYVAGIEDEGMDIGEIESRLTKIYSLQSRYNVADEAGLIELQDKFRKQLALIEDGDSILADLEDAAKRAKKAAVLIARKISERRIGTAATFTKLLKERATPMGMINLRCEISVGQSKLSPTGMDTVEFHVAFNKNQSLSPIGKSASGGEMSRLILAIKSIVAEKMQLPTIIFDEVDTGVSGEIATRMARLMSEISSCTQVITITHLPQVASYGAYHFRVFKEDDSESTTTRLTLLTEEERITELAMMLSGLSEDANARATAVSLLRNAQTNHN